MKMAVITGVGQGIGQALAQKFLAEGWRVVGTTINGAADYAHNNLTLVQLDLRVAESLKRCAEAVKKLGPIDVLINNAGVLLDEKETELKINLLRGTLEVNLIGLIDFTEQLVPALKSGSQVINISSTAGSLTLAGEGQSHYPDHYPAYKISKAALNMYTVTLARRLEKKNISVSSVHPGWVKTAMGGEEADISPAEAAAGIFDFTSSPRPTGRFWFQNQPLPW